MDRAARLQQIYDDAGRPGAQAFRFAVRRAGLQISEAEARACVAGQATGQIFRAEWSGAWRWARGYEMADGSH